MRTCFLIEDDEDDRELFAMALKAVDDSIHLIPAHDGVDGMEKLRHRQQGDVDFIFLDLNMPRMDGKQFLKEIKKDNRLRDIPVIIYSTSSDSDDQEETKRLGAEEFITKPAYIKDLTNILRNFFSERN